MQKATILRVNDIEAFPERLRGGVVAVGNFDGVHRGHQAVLNTALQCRETDTMPATALTFEPHPRSVFNPDTPVFRLTPAPLKAKLIGALGYDAILEMPFTRTFAQNSAADFVQEILVGRLGIRHVVTGFNFHFGKGRQGGPDFLREVGPSHGFGVSVVEPFGDENADLVSSSRIRACLEEGDVSEAAGHLGYHYSVEAPVIGGKQLGRTLGFPTANMALPSHARLRPGIYAVRFRRADGSVHNGVASFGRRPTVEQDGPILLETYVFDFEGDLYDETCCVSFFAYLRDEAKFDGLDALTEQMQRDAAAAREVLASARPQGLLDHVVAFG